MVCYNQIDLREGIDVDSSNKSNNSKECTVWHYSYFNDGFKFLNYFCNDCQALSMLCFGINDFAIIIVKVLNSRIVHNLSKSEALYLLENFVFDDCGYV